MSARLGTVLLSFFSRSFGRRNELGIYPTEVFRSIIERERGRSDRNSHGFSLVVFDAHGGNGNGNGDGRHPETVMRLAMSIVSRVRCTDEVGWLGDSTIGVLLPETPTDGAWKFSDYVRCELAKQGESPACRVFTYPSRGETGSFQGADQQLLFDDVLSAVEPLATGQSSVPSGGQQAACSLSEGIEQFLAVPLDPSKRAFDFIVSLLLLVFFAPLMGLIALFIKSVSRGPVLFKQERVGYMGKRFYCYKFRTMYVDSDISTHQKHFSDLMKSNGPMKKLDVKSDRRIIPFGKILRVCGLDELPQLLNVLKGDMSLIGPRPCIPYEYEQYQRWHRQRVDATPGLTGLWQVSGKNRTSFVEMMRLDIAYAKRRTLWMDLWILARTGPAMLVQVWDTACERARRRDAVGVPQLSRN